MLPCVQSVIIGGVQLPEKYPYPDPVIVLGPARSGTSAVARVLHEKVGVSMGTEFKPYDPVAPDGHYEEKEINDINREVYAMHIPYSEWWNRLYYYTQKMRKLEIPWGFKDPKLSLPFILGMVLCFYDDALFVRCSRTKEQTIESNMRCFSQTEHEAESLYLQNNRSLDCLLWHRRVIFMEMSDRRTDDEIKDRLEYQATKLNQPLNGGVKWSQ